MKKILRVDKIQKFYGNKDNLTKAIDGISFDVQEGEFIGIMGASGSGKTTLLNCISTIDTVSSGHIYLEEQDITEIKEENIAKFRRENLGFIFQDFNLLDTLTIEENIALILTINKIPEKDIDNKVKEFAKKLGIEDILNKYPYQVSGGQKQRCASARAIVNSPKIILADEPTGALDYNTGKQILKLLQDTCRKENMTVIADKGLVGHVISVTDSTAKVQTIVDTSSSVSCLMSTNKDSIVCKGTLENNTTLKGMYIPTDANVIQGDSIETSGLGGIYPKGIHVGTVKSVSSTKNAIDRYAEVETAVDFGKLDTVLVINN